MPSPSTPLQNRRRPAAIAIGPQTSTRSISVVPATDAVFALSGDVTLSAGDLEIGAVELKNATTDDRAKIAVPATIAAGDIVVGVHDPALNVAQWLGSTAPSVGQKAKTASLPVTLASDEDAVSVDGQGTAGTPVGGVVSVQGVAGGQPIPVSGIASNPSVGTDNAAKPSSDTLIGGSDGTNLQAARVKDLDTGVGDDYNLGVSLRLPALGGSVAGGTVTDPLRTDPTGTTAQPITATSLPLPTGAATSANQTTLGNQTTKINDGTTTAVVKAASTAAVATDPALVVAVSPNNTVLISAASLPLPAGAATEVTLAAIKNTDGVKKITDALPTGDNRIGRIKITDDTNVMGVDAQNHAYVAGKSAVGVAPGSNPVSVSGVDGGGLKRVILTDTAGRVQENVSQWLGSTAPSVGQKTAANSLPVVLASDQNQVVNAATVTSVAGSASSVTLLAANTGRISASISNDSTAILYAKFGATASTSSFTVRIPANVYYEVPVGRDGKVYNGRIDGIWSVALGNARITEVA